MSTVAPSPTAPSGRSGPRHLAGGWTLSGDDGPDTLTARLVISGLSIVTLLIGSIAWAAGATHLRVAALLFFCLVGLGSAPFALHPGLRLPARAALSTLVGFSVLTFIATVMQATHWWHPGVAFLIVSVLALGYHVLGLARAGEEIRRGPAPGGFGPHLRTALRGSAGPVGRRSLTALAAIVLGAALCLIASTTHRHLVPGFGGFPAQIGVVWYLGLALIVAAVVLLPKGDERVLCLGVLVLVLVLTLTPAIVYDGPRAQSAFKHVDLIDQIRQLHRLNSTVGIYDGWPGFFAAMAWLCDITGIRNPLSLALYWPPLLAVFRVAALRYFAGQVLTPVRVIWTAVTLAVLADSIGADYFSPQSVGFVVSLIVFGLVLSSRRSALRIVLILCAGCLLAITHQLSPYVVGGVLVVLVIFRQVKPWWTPLLVIAPTGLWALLHRGDLAGFISLDAIGQFTNFRPPVTKASAGLGRLPDVAHASYALLVGVLVLVVLAVAVLIWRRTSLLTWALICSAGVGLAFVAINPYGNEAIFRATLFGIPWLAVLAARVFGHANWRLTTVALAVVAAGMSATFLISSFTLDPLNVIRQADVQAFQAFDHQGGGRTTSSYLLLLGLGDLPTPTSQRGDHHVLVSQKTIGTPVQQLTHSPGATDVLRLTRELVKYSGDSPRATNLFAFWSPVSGNYDEAYGLQTYAQFADLRDAFAASPYWQVISRTDGTFVFRLETAKYLAQPAAAASTTPAAAVTQPPSTPAPTTTATTTPTDPAATRTPNATSPAAPSSRPLLTPLPTYKPGSPCYVNPTARGCWPGGVVRASN